MKNIIILKRNHIKFKQVTLIILFFTLLIPSLNFGQYPIKKRKWYEIQSNIKKRKWYEIQSKVSGLYLDVKGGSKKAKTIIWQYTRNNGDAQKWKFIAAGKGYYYIKSKISGLYLDVKGGSKEPKTIIWQYTLNGSDAQKWKLIPAGGGYYFIKSKISGLYLDVQGGNKNSKTIIWQYTFNRSDSQKWKLRETRPHRSANDTRPPDYKGSTTTTTTPSVPPKNESSERLGTNASSLPEKFSKIDREEFSLFKEVFNIHNNIFTDINPKSNIYYYVPANYSLNWKKESNTYDFNIHYNASSEGNKRGKVGINIELTANIDAEDIKIAEAYLTSKLNKKISLLSMDLRENPKVEFGSFASNFDVDPETLSTTVPTDYKKPIILNWRMDSGVDNFVSAMFNNSSGDVMMNFKPFADSISNIPKIKDILVPINLKVNDHKTYGKIKFNSIDELTKGWVNYLDYPVIPKKLIVLIKKGNRQSLQAVSLNRETISSGKIYRFNGSISDKKYIKKVWLDYDIDSECDECNKKVKTKIIGGTSSSQIANVSIEVINPLEYSEANSIKVYIKSKQVDPNGLNEIELKPFHINEDGQTISDIQLFVPQGKALFYNYRVVMIMDNGDIFKSNWRKSDTDILVLGEKQVNSLFPRKRKNEILDNAKNIAIEKLKDKLLGKDATEEDMINTGIGLLGKLFKKKKGKKGKKKNKEKEEEEEKDEDND